MTSARTGGPVFRLRHSSLSVKLVLLSVTVTAAVVMAVFAALTVQLRANTRRLFAGELRTSQQTLLELQRRSLRELRATLSVITENPTLRAAMETYRVELAAAHAPRTQLLATIQRETDKIFQDLGRDILIVTNDRGVVVAANDRDGVRPAAGADLSGLPPIGNALDPAADPEVGGFAALAFGAHYFQVACVPIIQRGYTIGTLTLGEHLQRTFVPRLRSAFGGEIVVVAAGQVVSSTLPEATPAGEFRPLATPDVTGGTETPTMRLAGQDFVMAALPLGLNQDGQPVVLYMLRSLTGAVAPLNRALLLDLAVYGTLAVVLVGVGTGLLSRSALHPFRGFVDFMRSVAVTGDSSARFDASGSSSEVRSLNDTYGQLIASLAQHHSQLEQRSRELSVTNETLRNQIVERERAERALKESEEHLRQAQKLESLGTLAGGVAHDFNNLLTVITSYADLAMRDVARDSRVQSDLEQIRQAAARAAALTGQLLAFSRKQVLQPKVIDLTQIVGSTELMLRRLIGEHIELQTLTAEPLPRIKADPGQIEQVILNLVVNGRDAMPRGGKLIIETAAVELKEPWVSRYGSLEPGRWVMLSVSDSGTGMDEATRARIFEPFFTTKAAGKGTGLGLATVYGIVSQSGGHIIVYSEPGRGTSFKIYLPQVDDLGEPLADGAKHPSTRGGDETILLVEDEDRVRELTQRVLADHGYKVVAARDGLEALQVASRLAERIHLLLTDVVMPNLGGRELVQRLAPLRPETKVLYVSGYTDDAIVQHGVLDPGTNFLQKPFTPDVLARRVREVLDGGRGVAQRPASRA